MREIKFRAWNGKSFVPGIPITATKVWRNEHGPQDYMSIGKSESDYDDGSHWILEQYTGFKDKNGVDIYEGDILNTPDGYAKVEWEAGCYWLEFDSRIPGGWMPKRIDEYGIELIAKKDDKIDLEVIGNVHENPELLK